MTSRNSFFSDDFFAVCSHARLVFVLHVFLDETGTNKRHPITGVAGFLFDRAGVSAFEREWQLRSYKLIKPYRTAHCAGRHGQFFDWEFSDRLMLMGDLARLITKTRQAGFIATVTQADFDEFARGSPTALPFIRSPYSLCLLKCLYLVGSYMDKMGIADDVHYWIEAGDEHEQEGADFLRRIRNSEILKKRCHVGGSAFIPKTCAPALCSADLIGWLWQRIYTEAMGNDDGKVTDEWNSIFEIIRSDRTHPLYIQQNSVGSISVMAMVNHFYGVHSDGAPDFSVKRS